MLEISLDHMLFWMSSALLGLESNVAYLVYFKTPDDLSVLGHDHISPSVSVYRASLSFLTFDSLCCELVTWVLLKSHLTPSLRPPPLLSQFENDDDDSCEPSTSAQQPCTSAQASSSSLAYPVPVALEGDAEAPPPPYASIALGDTAAMPGTEPKTPYTVCLDFF